MNDITYVKPTVETLLGIKTADGAAEDVLSLCRNKCDRILLYNPDAIAWWLYEKYGSFFDVLRCENQLIKKTKSVMPCVTPVCFASMYSGLMPEKHGIKSYVKPVLTCETLFDVLIRNGMHPAICSTEGDSISKIFLERDMEYYLYPTVDEVNAKARELIERDKNEVIVVYNGNYDAAMHKVSPEGDEALSALRENIQTYAALRSLCEKAWKGHTFVTAFLPDHGCHEIDGKMGSHGLDMEEDMWVVHFWETF